MAIHVALHHRTEYHFDRLVQIMPHVLRLRPAPHCRTPIIAYSLHVEPQQHFINWQQDPFANYCARLVFPEKARSMVIDVEVIAEMTVINPFDFFLEESAQKIPFAYEDQLRRDLAPYLQIRERGPLLMGWLGAVERTPKASVDFLVELNSRLQQEIGYVVRMEPGVQSCEETLSLRRGSCRDSAWLLVQILRHLGLAARFVSGYLVQLTADQKALDGPSGPERDFTDLHAWAEVYVPGAGWLGLDPTSGLFAAEGHIPLACTPDPASAAPVTGTTGVCKVEFRHVNEVSRIHEDPRVTRPYTEAQWRAIDALGEQVDAELRAGDVRLTMGGEPTFVSIDDMEGAEWNSAALGERKFELAGKLIRRLEAKFGAGALLHTGQGKWYPGEPLPRWALSLFWREDGIPIWREPRLLAGDSEGGVDLESARDFLVALCRRLGVDSERMVAGYEDDFHYLWREGLLPDNVDLHDSKLRDPLERARLRDTLLRGLEVPTGFALPLKWQAGTASTGFWRSSEWTFRRGRMYLLPGNSSMGLRLPLDSLPWEPPQKKRRAAEMPRDPFEARGTLPEFAGGTPGYGAGVQEQQAQPEEDWETIHTALCVEPRDGRLCVFLPPLMHLEHYLELIAAIEACAAALQLPVLIEGYEPPRDPRLCKLQVTPDPGVIEVNIQPARSWREMVWITETLYEEARQSRLGTEKFMLDGRHTGTGGGNHVTMGAALAADSPFLRRPDLLRSLISYWQNHPSLSYLFSGLFIGPTSQAPRVDEARDDNLYELEIAFRQLPEGESDKPWLVDRVLRNFLVDLTGNTHRAEFCIDKLYSPDSASGRLGLVEFRNFEMPPHPRMGLVQMLLLRALVSHFWRHPYRKPLVRWGTELHDRFMLPHYVWADFKRVLGDLREAGYPLETRWFEPFEHFRFPLFGRVQIGDVELELRGAIEPWHVLGEESTGQGTARYVDSSVERLQVKASGLGGERFVVACNGRPVPLRATGTRGEFVAGIRYKAWAPSSALHPTIPVATPLVFDLVDTRNMRSLGGCTYHVSHPGGRNYDTFPVNANEAEARRHARFWPHGHTQRELALGEPDAHADHPYTLDLRYW